MVASPEPRCVNPRFRRAVDRRRPDGQAITGHRQKRVTPASLRMATDIAEIELPNRFRRGTHRTVALSETLAQFRPFALQMGITRLGNITGLDRIGIPVVTAARPNSRSASVS